MALCYIKIQQLSNSCLSLSDLCTLSLCLTKLTRQTRSMAYRNQSPRIRPPTNYHTRRRRFSTPRSDLSHTRHQDGLVVPRSTWPKNLVILRTYTRHRVFISSPHAETCLPRTEEQMLMSSGDIVTPR